MADVLNRETKERKLARAISAEFRRFLAEIVALVPSVAEAFGVDAEAWRNHAAMLTNVIDPQLESTYLQQAEMMLGASPIGVDWALVNEAAANWARDYTFELVTGLRTSSERVVNAQIQKLLQDSVADYFESGQARRDLEQRLVGTFGPVRAEMIATTEITRAASEGEQRIAAELDAAGAGMVPIWQTNNDDLVCPICGPRNGKEITDGDYPPAHPNCRCWVNHVFRETL